MNNNKLLNTNVKQAGNFTTVLIVFKCITWLTFLSRVSRVISMIQEYATCYILYMFQSDKV